MDAKDFCSLNQNARRDDDRVRTAIFDAAAFALAFFRERTMHRLCERNAQSFDENAYGDGKRRTRL